MTHIISPLMKKTLFALLACVSILAPSFAAPAASAQTLKNLNAAFQGESNASNRYAIFAKKADADGFPMVAKLFRAASASESIHRDSHKAAIEKLGGTVDTFVLEAVTPASTEENLKAAIKGETYEVQTMYPGFLALAKTDDAKPAIRSFQSAEATEKEHILLYEAALANLGKNLPVDYYVCSICGATLTELPAKKCPICRQGREKFNKIN